MQLTRHDEFISENYGSACVIAQQAGLNANGAIDAWACETWTASLGGRPGYDKPGNVITGLLAGFDPEMIKPQTAVEPTEELRNGNNAVPSYVVGCVNGKCGGAGAIRSERVLTHAVKSPFFTGPLRSPLRLQNTFAHECFMDEISSYVKADPVAYRLQHLRETRIMDVVKAAAKATNWMPVLHPSPTHRAPAQLTGAGSLASPIRAITGMPRSWPRWKWINRRAKFTQNGSSLPTIVDQFPTLTACAIKSRAEYCKAPAAPWVRKLPGTIVR